MATTRDIVDSALRRITVLDRFAESSEDNDAQTCLDALNGMMHSWKGKGLTYEHTTLGFNDTFPLDDENHEGFIAMLAVRASDDFGGPNLLTQKVIDDANDGEHLIVGKYWDYTASDHDLTLKRLPSHTSESSVVSS